jgi:hypothetical protein
MDEIFRASGIEVRVTPEGEIVHEGVVLGRVGREQRFGQWFWRAYDSETGEPLKRFLTSRPEAIQLLLLRADLIEGIGF